MPAGVSLTVQEKQTEKITALAHESLCFIPPKQTNDEVKHEGNTADAHKSDEYESKCGKMFQPRIRENDEGAEVSQQCREHRHAEQELGDKQWMD